MSLKTQANSAQEAKEKIQQSYKVDEVLEISSEPFTKGQLFTKFQVQTK